MCLGCRASAASHSNSCCPLPAGLIELEICRGGLERLPPGLSAATALARLTLDSNNRLALSHSDAEVLRRLPRLQALQAQYTATPSRVAVHLRLLAPQLEAVWSLGQVFHRLGAPSRQAAAQGCLQAEAWEQRCG